MKYLILFLGIFSIQAKPLDDDNVVVAVDCGSSNSYTAPEGFEFKADDYYFGQSRVGDYTYSEILATNTLKYTMDPVPYTTERHGEGFGYDLPLIKPGKYTLILKFVELYFTHPNQRQFNIQLGDFKVRENFSILRNVPGQVYAHDEYIEFELKDETILYKGQVCQNAYKYKTKRVVVEFTKGAADLPKIDGIILVEGGIEKSNYAERKQLVDNWEVIENQKRQQQQQQALQGQEKTIEEVSLEQEVAKIIITLWQEPESLVQLLYSWKGITIQIILVVFFFCICVTDSVKENTQKPKKQKK